MFVPTGTPSHTYELDQNACEANHFLFYELIIKNRPIISNTTKKFTDFAVNKTVNVKSRVLSFFHEVVNCDAKSTRKAKKENDSLLYDKQFGF